MLPLLITSASRAADAPASSAAPATPPAPAAVPWAEVREQTFASVWGTVNEAYYDGTFGGVDWKAVRDQFHERLLEATDNSRLRVLLQQMLLRLSRSHFGIIPRDAAVFTPAERTRIGTCGLRITYTHGEVVIAAVESRSPGAQAGIRPGDVLLRVDDVDLRSLEGALAGAGVAEARRGLYLTDWVNCRLRGSEGSVQEVVVLGPDSTERVTRLTCAAFAGTWSEPIGNFPSQPVEFEQRNLGDGIVYVRFNVFTRETFREVKKALLALPPHTGLVLDLRGNPGGLGVIAPGIGGWLFDHESTFGEMHLRQGFMRFPVFPQPRAFLGPVAVLIDGGTASTGEILAAGLQDTGRANVFGESSAGAALPSIFKTLPTGDLFQYAIADVVTPRGRMIEGQGIQPDLPVDRTPADLAAGRDPVLDAAQHWLTLRLTPAPDPKPAHP